MSFIYSTESEFASWGGKRLRNATMREFARVIDGTNKNTVYLSCKVCRDINLGKWAKVGYDAESNVLIIMPLIEEQKGAVLVQYAGSSVSYMRQKICLNNFFHFIGAKDLQPGRYRIEVEKDRSAVKVFLNDTL